MPESCQLLPPVGVPLLRVVTKAADSASAVVRVLMPAWVPVVDDAVCVGAHSAAHLAANTLSGDVGEVDIAVLHGAAMLVGGNAAGRTVRYGGGGVHNLGVDMVDEAVDDVAAGDGVDDTAHIGRMELCTAVTIVDGASQLLVDDATQRAGGDDAVVDIAMLDGAAVLIDDAAPARGASGGRNGIVAVAHRAA